MSKVSKEIELAEEAIAFEMIELTCNELDSLTKAFNMISDLCTELQGEVAVSEVKPSRFEIN